MYFILIIRVNNTARIMVHKSLKVGLFYYSIGTNTQVVFYFTFFLAYLKKKTPKEKKKQKQGLSFTGSSSFPSLSCHS